MGNLLARVVWKTIRTIHFENKLSDEQFLMIRFKVMMNEKLNLEDPQTFNQKLQWMKIYNRRNEYTSMVDKYEAKFYVSSKIGNEFIIPTLGVWDKFDDINFESLPNQFVLKCTHDSGGIVIVRDKSVFNVQEAKNKIESSLANNFYYNSREWPYKNVKPRIIAEQYMSNGAMGLRDYKFYCFNGEPKYLYVSEGLEDHETASMSFLDMNWNLAPFGRVDYRAFKNIPDKPHSFNEMIVIAKKLSAGQAFLRVDLYEINGKVYFSELTFSPCGGYMPFQPREWDMKLGKLLDLSLCKGKSEK